MEEKILNKKIEETKKERKAEVLFQTVSFKLDPHIYAMDVMSIQEIIFAHKIYKVPNTDEKLLGVLNLRGNILPVYSIKMILGMEDTVKNLDIIEDEEKFIIMIKREKDIFGILIDGIYKNINATDENYRTGKFIQDWSKNSLFKGVVLEGSKEILVINVESLLKYIITLK